LNQLHFADIGKGASIWGQADEVTLKGLISGTMLDFKRIANVLSYFWPNWVNQTS